MWVSAPITTPWGTTNQHLTADTVTNVICAETYNVTATTLASLGIPESVIISSSAANGCSVVTPLPNAVAPSRIAYKLYFDVTPDQWTSITAVFHSTSGKKSLVRDGHTMCGSTIYFQTSSGANTSPELSYSNQPSVSSISCM